MVPIVLRRFEEDSKVSSQNYYRSLKVLSLKLILVVKMPSNLVMWFFQSSHTSIFHRELVSFFSRI